ncbi:ubiquitin carboxyl-terminal hydrolase [Nitzschia inconspicua]|uniref:Ubiquitin carboxyl-terminal hydrolase n=1 Tax=Nitzschia inconspicua TaxID=303405 RepID=A0A9K3LMI5_9STRA|nr:ubiquitin carboxyl-terminal hydrolase [Nitzschia inconspicua]
MKPKNPKLHQFLLQQQLPDDLRVSPPTDHRTQTSSASSSSLPPSSSTRIIKAVDHVNQLALESCRCIHLQEYLPHLLDLQLCRSTLHPRGWIMANPVHSLHLASTQLENVTPVSQRNKPPPVLYGEEQQRTEALRTRGIVEYWSPLDGFSTAMDDETSPLDPDAVSTLEAIKKQQQQQEKLADPSPPTTSCSPPTKKARLDPDQVGSITGEFVVSAAAALPTTLSPKAVSFQEATTSHTKDPVAAKSSKACGPGGANMVEDSKKCEAEVAENVHQNIISDQSKVTATVDVPDQDVKMDEKKPSKEGKDDDAVENFVEARMGKNGFVAIAEEITSSGKESTVADTEAKTEAVGAATIEGGSTAVVDTKQKVAEPAETRVDERMGLAETKKDGSEHDSKATKTTQQEEITKKEDQSKDETFESGVHSELTFEKNDEATGENQIQRLVVAKSSQETIEKLSKEDVEPAKSGVMTDDHRVKKEPTGVLFSGGKNQSDPVLVNGQGEKQMSSESESVLVISSHDEKSHKTTKPETTTSSGLPILKEGHVKEERKGPVDVKNDEANISDPVVVTSQSSPSKFQSASASSGPSSERISEKKEEQTLPSLKADPYFEHLRSEEDRIRLIRQSIAMKRGHTKSEAKDASSTTSKKKRKRDADIFKPSIIPGWRAAAAQELSPEQEDEWLSASRQANETVENWMTNYRLSRESFWMGRKPHKKSPLPSQSPFYLHREEPDPTLCCQWCVAEEKSRLKRATPKKTKERKVFVGDELMRCLECSFVGCSPSSFAPKSKKHILQHLLISGHQFAVSCGEKAQIFCFSCGDIVYHDVFEQEKIRIDCSKRLSYMGWKEHYVLRSFDAFQFLKTQDHGIVWRGLIATYPPNVPREHFFATQLVMRRQSLFEGNTEESWVSSRPKALSFTVKQHAKTDEEKYRVAAPVGMYNHGNTCYMSAILQCLIFCEPLQQYFLKKIGHHHKSCEMYRKEIDVRAAVAKSRISSSKSKKLAASSSKKAAAKLTPQICLACEMDRLFLSYFGSTNGVNVFSSLEETYRGLVGDDAEELPGNGFDGPELERGCPLLISDLITSAWKSGGMDHLAGYEQRDAHEFLNSFLELLGKDIVKFRDRVFAAVTCIGEENALSSKPKPVETDVVSHLFEGSLRSVLLCERCGVKRVQHEPFVNISLSLSEEVERMQRGKCQTPVDMSVEACLEHFVLPEKLGDLVFCTSCGRKTETKKQHTFSKLPKVLCLHLKRFDAAQNKKIENFVSFPAFGLNLGSFLSHWCEVSRLGDNNVAPGTEPNIIYDLFGTVNHKGNMQSGHYVANVKVGSQWYSCNDQMVCSATEGSVLTADGAYVLFYMRRL